MDCAVCHRPASEHTVLPDRDHPTTGCGSFAFSFLPSSISRLEGILDVIKRRDAGEKVLHCHCLATSGLKACSNCGFFLCPDHHADHEKNCTLPEGSRRPGMPSSQPEIHRG